MLDFQAKLKQINKALEEPILSGHWPKVDASLNLFDALEAAGKREQAKAIKHAQTIVASRMEMLKRPIIGVMGELNSGKSSVVSSFLSESGRDRLPRGEDNEHGTHRFVYWVPSNWMSDEEIKNSFLELLDQTHGNRREYLSQVSADSAKQYRSGIDDFEKIGIPLIADDANLDNLEAGFLDCPDAQTKDTTSVNEMETNQRLDFISRSALICSAFLLVWERAKLRDRMLETFLDNIRKRMPTVPLYLLINKIRPEEGQPGKTRRDADLANLVDKYKIHSCYGAFDFDIVSRGERPGWNDLTPPALVEKNSDEGNRFPQFFRISADDNANNPETVNEDLFLSNLPSQLDAAELQQKKQDDNWNELATLTRNGLNEVNAWSAGRFDRAQHIHDGLLELCVSRFTNQATGEPLQILSTEYAKAYAESFVRTAPAWARVMLRATKPFDRGMSWGKSKLVGLAGKFSNLSLRNAIFPEAAAAKDKIKGIASNGDDVQQVEKRFEELGVAGVQLTDAHALAHQMHTCRWVPESILEADLAKAWVEIVQNANRYRLKYNDDQEHFDVETREFWKSASIWQKSRLVGSNLLRTLGSVAAIGGVAVAAVDGGATLITFYSFTGTISAAIPGLSALGIAAVGGAGALAGVSMSAVHHNTLPNLSRYFALACDAFGVPRQIEADANIVKFGLGEKKSKFKLPDPKVPDQLPCCQLEDIRLWKKTDVVQKIRELTSHER